MVSIIFDLQVKDTTAGIIPLAKAPWMLDTEEKEEDIHVVKVCYI